MPIEISLPFPDPQPNLRIGWPRQGAGLTVGGPFDVIGFNDNFVPVNTWGAPIGVGGNTMDFQDGILCALFGATVQRPFTPYAIIKPTVTALNPGLTMPQQQRVYRLQWLMRMAVPSLDRASGLQFSPTNVLGGGFTQAGAAAFGVVGDATGTGQWEYIQSGAGAFPGNVSASQVIPTSIVPDATEWSTFDIEIINSAPGRAATMSLFVNNVFVLSKNWTTFSAPDLAPLAQAITPNNKFIWLARSATAAAGFFMGPLTVDMGRFTRAGLELLQ